MKTTNKLLTLIAILLFSVSNTYGQSTHVITLHVDTDQLNAGNESEAFSFSVSEGTNVENIDNPKTFTIFVNEEDTVIWEGTSLSGATVNIESITYSEGTEIFGKQKQNGKVINGKKKVDANVKRGKKNAEYKYDIEFMIGRFTFNIDPIIKVK